jgi:hypothetical protein
VAPARLERQVNWPRFPPWMERTALARPAAEPVWLGDGFYQDEEDAPGERFRWSDVCATAEVERPLRLPATVRLRYRCPPADARILLRAGVSRLAIDDCVAGARREVSLRVGEADFGRSFFLPVDLLVSETFIPARDGAAEDARRLGVRVYSLDLDPETAPQPPLSDPDGTR